MIYNNLCTSLMCSQTKNTEHPNFLATDRTYLALFIISSSDYPRVTKSQLINQGSKDANNLKKNQPVAIFLSFKLVILYYSSTWELAHLTRSSSFTPPTWSLTSTLMSCQIIARINFLLPSTISTPPIPTALQCSSLVLNSINLLTF